MEFFNYVQNPESDEPIMLINKHIGYDENEGYGIDGSLFQQEILALDEMGKKRIQVWINSVGGRVMDGYNIANAILKSKTPVDTVCVGMAASIAGVIFQCGRKRIMSDYGILMYHNPYAGETTDSPMLETMKASLNKIISDRCGMDPLAVGEMMDRTSFIGAPEAVLLGLCDEIEETVKLNTKFFPKAAGGGAKSYWNEANKVLNKFFEPKNKIVMQKVTNKLQLNAEANEDAILSAVNALETRATEAENALQAEKDAAAEKVTALKTELDGATAKLTELQKKLDDAQAELDAAANAAKQAEEAATAEKAKNLVHDAVKVGKIKNDAEVINAMIVKASADFDGVKTMIEAIPLNKTATKFEVKIAENKVVSNPVAMAMATISNKINAQK